MPIMDATLTRRRLKWLSITTTDLAALTLPHGVVDRLSYLREPGQSYSYVIPALANAE